MIDVSPLSPYEIKYRLLTHMETSQSMCLKVSEKCLPFRYCEEDLICQRHVAEITSKNKAQFDVGGLHNEVNSASHHISLIW